MHSLQLKYKVIILYSLSFILFNDYVQASDVVPLQQLSTKCYKTEDGLPQNTVNDIVVAENGMLVTAGYSGVALFNGSRFYDRLIDATANFPKMDAKSIEYTGNSLWVATKSKGLFYLTEDGSSNWSINDGLDSNEIEKVIALDSETFILNNKRLFTIKNQKLSKFTEVPFENKNLRVFKYNKNGLLVFTENEQWIYKGETWEKYKSINKNNTPPNFISTIKDIQTINENLTFSHNDKVILKTTDNNSEIIFNLNDYNKKAIINSVYIKNDHTILIATTQGVFRIFNNQIESHNNFPDDNISKIVTDLDNFEWFATNDGICLLKNNPIQNLTENQGVFDKNIEHITEFDDSIFAFPKTNTQKFYQITNFIVSENPLLIDEKLNAKKIVGATSNKNNLWIATNDSIAIKQDKQFVTVYQSNEVIQKIISHKNTLWVIESSVLKKLSGANLIPVPNLVSYKIKDISFNNKEYSLLTNEKILNYSIDENKIIKVIEGQFFCNFIKDNNQQWYCSDDLFIQDNQTLLNISESSNTHFGDVHQIIEDNAKNIWISSNTGISQISRSEIDKLLSDNKHKLEVVKYSEKNDLTSNLFSDSLNSYVKDSDERLWLANSKGITIIDTQYTNRIEEKLLIPIIEHMYVDNDYVLDFEDIKIPPTATLVHFHLNTIFLSQNNEINYRYRLTPFQQEWKSGSYIDFKNLPHGEYKFEGQVRYRDGVWSESIMKEFKIPPKWYQTWYFRFFSVLGICSIIWGLPAWKFYLLKQKKDELKELVNNQTKSLTIANQRLEKLLNLDDLTQIYNRRKFFSVAEQISQESDQSFCIALIDVDDFKAYNDHYGHIKGDSILSQVASILDGISSDQYIVARYGGEEFVILFQETSIEESNNLLLQIKNALSNQAIPHIESKTKTLTLSYGLVERKANESLGKLLERADKAMYEAKEKGKNKIVIA